MLYNSEQMTAMMTVTVMIRNSEQMTAMIVGRHGR
jgi:hypothetical protein